jgi:hypothetical protein
MSHRKKTSGPDLSWRQAGQCVLAQAGDYNRTSFLSIRDELFGGNGKHEFQKITIEKWKCTVIAVLKGRSCDVSNCGCDFACHSPLATSHYI